MTQFSGIKTSIEIILMKWKNPEEILKEIIEQVADKRKDREIYDNIKICIQDSTDSYVDKTKTLKEYLKESLLEVFGRSIVGEYSTAFEIFIKEGSVRVEIVNDSVFICGRYRKTERGISNTPMVFHRTAPRRKRDQSFHAKEERMPAVSDWMDPFTEYFQANKAVFISGGREDYDVRMLGNGRPFLCRIEDPCRNLPKKVGVLSRVISEEGRQMEEYGVEYKPLEIPYKLEGPVELLQTYLVEGDKAMKEMKKIEEEHCKVYGVKVTVDLPEETLKEKLISSYWEESEEGFTLKSSPLDISQKTPIRVMHRRANLSRKKTLYECRIEIEPECEITTLYIQIKSSSGTYIKEFVNGDMGRTVPSLSEVVGEYCDVVELDVLSIDDTFPNKEYVLASISLIKK